MKFKLFLALFIVFSFKAFSQTKNNISVLYGINSDPVNIHDAIGDYGYETRSGTVAGVMYTRNIKKFFSLQTGLIYSYDPVELSTIEGGRGEFFHRGDVKALSIPVYAKLTFFKYFYFDSGLSGDIQTNYYQNNGAIRNQSGLGGELGIGVQVPLGPAAVFVNAYTRQYNITAYDNNLNEFGVKFGVGLNF